MTWLLKVEVETKEDAEKMEKVIDSMSRFTNHPVKLIDIEFEELEDDNFGS